jgi:hypothetical protein
VFKNITIQLQKEKEGKIQKGHQKILEDEHVKYDGIISKANIIRDQAWRIEHTIVSEKKIDDMDVQNEGKPSKARQYRHPNHQESLQERQED